MIACLSHEFHTFCNARLKGLHHIGDERHRCVVDGHPLFKKGQPELLASDYVLLISNPCHSSTYDEGQDSRQSLAHCSPTDGG